MTYLKDVATLTYRPERCTGCGMCVNVCPRGVFVMDGKVAAITDRDRCIECGACALNCEYLAITVTSGVGCAAAVIGSMIRGGEPSCGCGGSEGGACCG